MKTMRFFLFGSFFLVIISIASSVQAYGYNFIFPAPLRARISRGYILGSGSPGGIIHLAYDYPFPNYTKIAAAKHGSVKSSRWYFEDNDAWWTSCTGSINDRGNYIVLDHGDDLESWYFHLSKSGNTPVVGAFYSMGGYMALSDHTGCSSNPHLHFATKLNGTAFDPYSEPHWVGDLPVPAGYVDQNHEAQGPFAINRVQIKNEWVALEGKLGSPLGDDYYSPFPPVGRSPDGGPGPSVDKALATYVQDFERGQIYFTVPGAAQVLAYGATYIPDVRAHRPANTGGWNTIIYVRNDGSVGTDVNITILNSDGTVKDTRTYRDLERNATWTLDVRDVVYSAILNDWTNDFSGSAVVYSDQDVSVTVTQGYNGGNVWAAYSGVSQPASRAYVPVLHKNNSGWNSQIFIQNTGDLATDLRIDFKPWVGVGNYHTIYAPVNGLGTAVVNLNEIGDSDLGSTFIGAAYVSNGAGQPLAVAWSQYKGNLSLMEASNSGGVGQWVYAPLIQNYNSGWASGVAMQNASPVSHSMSLRYHRYDDGWNCKSENRNISGYHVYMYPSPPGYGFCTFVLTGRILGNGYNAAANINQLKSNTHMATDYAAIASPSTKIGIPLVWKAKDGWNSGIVIQNTSGYPTSVTITYYAKNGDQVASRAATIDYLGEAYVIYPISTGNNFEGSAVVTASSPVAVVVNHLQSGSGGDRIMTHIGMHHD